MATSGNGWRTWVIGILGLILLSVASISIGSHLSEVKDVKFKTDRNTESMLVIEERVKSIDDRTKSIQIEIEKIRNVLIGGSLGK